MGITRKHGCPEVGKMVTNERKTVGDELLSLEATVIIGRGKLKTGDKIRLTQEQFGSLEVRAWYDDDVLLPISESTPANDEIMSYEVMDYGNASTEKYRDLRPGSKTAFVERTYPSLLKVSRD